MSLILKNVSKTFVGKQAVDNISFSLENQEYLGYLEQMEQEKQQQ